MKKKILGLLLALVLITGVSYYVLTKNTNEYAIKFKEEYESLNGQKTESGKTIRTITISKDNPMIYKTEDEIVEMIENKETFAIYFGFAKCPWCRSILPNLLKVSKDIKLYKIYYVDVLNIRDTLKLDENNNVVKEKDGTKGYQKLLELLDKVLDNYTLKNENGETIDTGEKRIYAPNIVAIINGSPQELTTGISEKQTDGYMKLTKEMNKESYNLIKCTLKCITDAKSTCSAKSMC